MNQRLRIASIMLYVVSALAIVVGLLLSFSPTIMPYHERFLGTTHEQLEPKVATLLLALMRGVGVASLSIGVGIAMLVRGPFGKGDRRAWWTILIMSLVYLIPSVFISLSIGLYTPWWGVALMIVLVVAAMVISRSPGMTS